MIQRPEAPRPDEARDGPLSGMRTTGVDGRAAATARPGLSMIARGGVLNLMGAAISAVAGVVLVVVVTRTLPPAEAGVFFTLTSLFLLAQMAARLGTNTGLVYFVARLRSLGRPDLIRTYERVALTPVVGFSLVVAGVLVVWSPELAGLVGSTSDAGRVAVVLLALLLPVTTLSDALLSATRGHAVMLPTVALERVTRPLLQLGLVVPAVALASLPLLSAAWALPWVLTTLLAAWWLRHLQRDLPSPAGTTPDRAPWREFWAFTSPRAVTSLVQLALQRLDIVLIAVLIGPAQAAVYTAATRFLVAGQVTAAAISTAAQPRLAEVLARDDRPAAKAIYQTATGWIVLSTWPLYLLCAVFADAVMTIFGSGYAGGRSVILVLAGGMLLAEVCGMVDMLLNMAGRTAWTLGNSLLALLVMVGLDVLLIPRLGIMGAAIGWAVALAVNNLLPLTQLLVTLRLHPFGRGTLIAVLLSGTCFGALPVVARLLLPGDPWAALLAIAAGGVLYLLGCARFRSQLALPARRVPRGRHRAGAARDDLEQVAG
jgi:O-antigen/teichoic acid export membrane protein